MIPGLKKAIRKIPGDGNGTPDLYVRELSMGAGLRAQQLFREGKSLESNRTILRDMLCDEHGNQLLLTATDEQLDDLPLRVTEAVIEAHTNPETSEGN